VADALRPADSFFPEKPEASFSVTNGHFLRPIRHTAAKLMVKAQNNTALHLELCKLFDIGIGEKHEKDLQLESKSVIVYGTKNHPQLFKKLVKQDCVESWMQENENVYMLVSYISAINAHITVGNGQIENVNFDANLPISAAAGIPGHLNAGIAASQQVEHKSSGEGVVRGEVVFAAEYRKVKKISRVSRVKKHELGEYMPGVMLFGECDGSLGMKDDSEVEIETYDYELEDVLGGIDIPITLDEAESKQEE